jgi:hypothetical protein
MKIFWEWIFPILIVIGAVLTAYDIYPINKWFFLIGNGGLTVMCIIWYRWSLVALNSFLTVIYLSGILVK